MRISVITWARNEADVLEAWVRHHASFADRIRLVLHRTDDNSEEILTQLKAEGLPVVWSSDDGVLHRQQEVLSSLMHEEASLGADWVCPLDADEFLTGDVLKELSAQTRPLLAPWRGYVPVPSDAKEINVLKRIRNRRASESPCWKKVLIPSRVLTADPLCRLSRGNHGLLSADGMSVPSEESALVIRHFPVRSPSQVRRKTVCGWLTDQADATRERGVSFQWLELCERFRTREPTPEELTVIATDYASAAQWNRTSPNERGNETWENKSVQSLVCDPVPCRFEVIYPIRETDTEKVIQETEYMLKTTGVAA